MKKEATKTTKEHNRRIITIDLPAETNAVILSIIKRTEQNEVMTLQTEVIDANDFKLNLTNLRID